MKETTCRFDTVILAHVQTKGSRFVVDYNGLLRDDQRLKQLVEAMVVCFKPANFPLALMFPGIEKAES